MTSTPFAIRIPDAVIAEILDRVRRYPWADLPDAGGWRCGMGLDDMRALARHWTTTYDWRAEEARLNRLPQYRAEVDGLPLHFIHLRGIGPAPVPLLLAHSWPGSFADFVKVAEPLADPARFGGDPADAFDVVVPSLPGYGFSGRPPAPLGPKGAARILDMLMTDVLGYDRYMVQGGDWGGAVAAWLGCDHPACRALHLNMVTTPGLDMVPTTPEEHAYEVRRRRQFKQEGGYFQLQATKPQTLGFAMADSPVGVAAWIIEKFAAWSDLPRAADGTPDLGARYTPDELLTNVMIYLVTRSFITASWMYRGLLDERPTLIPAGTRIEVPVAVANFPDPTFDQAPRSLVEKTYNVTRWTNMSKGGHFPALEEPGLLINDLRAFARNLRPLS